ncbi:MAG: MFS transporter, partial [Halovenus sp.]
TEAALFLAYIGTLGIFNQGFLIGRLSSRFGVRSVVRAGVASLFCSLLLLAIAPLAGTTALTASAPPWFSGGFLVLLGFGALASFGNGSLSVGLASLVSESASEQSQGSAFGVTQGAGSLGRTVGPPLGAAAYVVVYWSPFVGGALLLVPVAVLLRSRA